MKKKFIISGLILVVAIGYLGFLGFRSSASYYYSVSELLAKGNSVFGQTVRVNGDVVPGSVERQGENLNMKFSVSDGGKALSVVYKGIVPDTFREGNPVVIEGSLDASGVFQARVLMPKCPSKYAPAAEAAYADGINSWQI